MPVFLLDPNCGKLDDPAWLTSRHRGPCIVVADTAEAARLYANCAFILAVAPAGLPKKTPTLPWSQPDLVTLIELRDATAEMQAAIGSVMVDGRMVHGQDDAVAPPSSILPGNALRHRPGASDVSVSAQPAGIAIERLTGRLQEAV